MRLFYAILIIFNLIGVSLLAKPRVDDPDSLKKLIRPALQNTAKQPDTLTLNRINKLADAYFESNPDSTTYYGNLEIRLAKQINYTKGIADGTSQLAAVNTFRSDYAASAQNYTTALGLYRQINHKPGIINCYNGLGRVQDYLGNYDNAIELFNKALALCLTTANDTDEAECYDLMGITYDNKGEFSKALDCYFKSLIINIKHKDNLSAADKYCNIGVVLQHLELYSKALAYHNRSLAIWQELGDKQGISTAYQNIGEVLMEQGKYPDAIGYLNKASTIFHQLGDKEGISLIYYDLGLYNYHTGHIDIAIHYLTLSLQTAYQTKIKYNKANAYVGLAMVFNAKKDYANAYVNAAKAQQVANTLGSLSIKVDAALQLSTALAGLKQFEQAYQQHQLYSDLKSNLKHNESIQKVLLYNLEIDFAKKQKVMADKQQLKDNTYQQKISNQKNQNLLYVIIIIIMTVVAVAYYIAKSKQQKINNLLAEKNKAIISQQEDLNSQTTKLNDLNLLKDRLIGVLAHDLRAPISTLRGLFTLMTDASITSEEFIKMTPKVFNTLEHTSDFLDTLLFWINSQVDGKEPVNKDFNIHALVLRELAHLEELFKQKELTTLINIATDAVAHGDPNCVRIVIHNFLTNAIKFSNRGGVIEILSYPADEGMVTFCIKDHGVGMSNEFLNTLFKSQVISSVGTEKESGTGMGLLFCRDLIEKHNGKIWANSHLGHGTELCFKLPAGVAVPA